jgi:uncharacterized protein
MPTLNQARAWYDPEDAVHGFGHIVRVVHLAEQIGAEVGADIEIVRAAALLHDASGAAPAQGGGRARHEQASADFAEGILRAEGWSVDRIEAVLHCIRAHRYRSAETPQSLEAKVLFDADKLDVLGAFGIARTLGYATQAGQPAYAEPSARFRQAGQGEPGEPHSAYHEYLFKLSHVAERLHTEPARRMAEPRVRLLRSFFEALAGEAGTGD